MSISTLISLFGCQTHYKPPVIEASDARLNPLDPVNSAPDLSFMSLATLPGWQEAHPADDQTKGQWWLAFHEAQLNLLMDQMLAQNHNLANLLLAYENANISVVANQAHYQPTLGTSIGRTQSGAKGSASSNSSNIKLNGSWEIDLWGKVKDEVKQAKANADVNKAQLANAILSAQGTLASTYYDLRMQDQKIALIKNMIKAYQESLRVAKNQWQQGITTKLDVMQAQTNLVNANQRLANFELLRKNDVNAIAALSGSFPETLRIPNASAGSIPNKNMPKMPKNISSDYLQRRPDIAQAQRQVMAANAEIGLARKAFYPSITLSSSSTWDFLNLFNAGSLVWSLGASAAQNIFDQGSRRNNLKISENNYRSVVNTYQQTVLDAAKEVTDLLNQDQYLQQQMVYFNSNLESTKEEERISTNQYKEGIADFALVSQSQIRRQEAALNSIQNQADRQKLFVSLMISVGGGLD